MAVTDGVSPLMLKEKSRSATVAVLATRFEQRPCGHDGS
jgi:hypothetical protein